MAEIYDFSTGRLIDPGSELQLPGADEDQRARARRLVNIMERDDISAFEASELIDEQDHANEN